MQLPDPTQDEPSPPLSYEFDAGEVYDDRYYIGIINMAYEADQWGHCFNCGKEGHCWAKCTELLKDSLKQVKERANHKKQSFNWDGGTGAKGAQPPLGRYSQGRYGQSQKLASSQLTPSAFWNEDPQNPVVDRLSSLTIQFNTVFGDRVFPVLSYVQEEAPLAY